MRNENTESPNSIKSSIWNTRTEQPISEIKDKIVGSTDKPTDQSTSTDNRD